MSSKNNLIPIISMIGLSELENPSRFREKGKKELLLEDFF